VTGVAGNGAAVALSWGQITDITGHLADAAAIDGTPAVIAGILRGGMIPAITLAHALGVREVRTADVTCTVSDTVNAPKTGSPVIRNPGSLGDLSGLDILLVDDIAGTGQTMQAARDLVAAAGAVRVRTAACAVNELNWQRRHPGGDPADTFTYIGARYRGWVTFPWEKQ
jgi:hypothetical protein